MTNRKARYLIAFQFFTVQVLRGVVASSGVAGKMLLVDPVPEELSDVFTKPPNGIRQLLAVANKTSRIPCLSLAVVSCTA